MTNNKMVCDLETGICGEAGDEAFETIDLNQPQKKITLYYVTDPICSHCWALEPVLRKFEEQYGQYFELHTVMGGLLESWDGFADVANGIGSPADVAGHWREVGEYSRMPIDGSLWLDNPVHSSFIPSRVYKIVQQQDEQLARTFLRRAREAVFAFNKNIADEQVLINIVNQLGLNGETIVKEAELPAGHELLNQDFALARSLGVRGFPTIIMVNEENKGVKIVGSRPLEYYMKGLEQILGTTEALQAQTPASLKNLFEKEGLKKSRYFMTLNKIRSAHLLKQKFHLTITNSMKFLENSISLKRREKWSKIKAKSHKTLFAFSFCKILHHVHPRRTNVHLWCLTPYSTALM